MTSTLLVEASPRIRSSISRRAGARIVTRLQQRDPSLSLQRRDLGRDSGIVVDAAFVEAMLLSPSQRDHTHIGALAQSESLIGELEQTDMLVIVTPMHNFTVPAVLKAWIDQVLRVGRTFKRTPNGKVGLLADRPTFVVVASGGFVTGNRARQPDFLTPYLEVVLKTLGIATIHFLHLEPVEDDSDRIAANDAHLQFWLDKHFPLHDRLP